MRLLHSLLLLCLLVSLPVNSVMAVMMPLCLPGTEQPVDAGGMHQHMAGAQGAAHAHNSALDACKLACEKCSVCAQAALPPSLIPLPQLPLTATRSLLPNALLPTPAPTPPFRPPLHLL